MVVRLISDDVDQTWTTSSGGVSGELQCISDPTSVRTMQCEAETSWMNCDGVYVGHQLEIRCRDLSHARRFEE